MINQEGVSRIPIVAPSWNHTAFIPHITQEPNLEEMGGIIESPRNGSVGEGVHPYCY